MGGPAPDGRAIKLVFLGKVLCPMNLPRHAIETQEIPHGAERVDALLVNQRRGARSAGVGNRVRAIVFVLPENLAIAGAEAQNTLVTRNAIARGSPRLAAGVQGTLAVHYVDTSSGNRRA